MTVQKLMQMLSKADPKARVFIEAQPDSNEWTGIKSVEVVTTKATAEFDLVDTNDRRIKKGSVLLAATGPVAETAF